MKTNLRGKIREFVQSEEGKVGVKSSLTLGAAVSSVLLAQAIVGTPTVAGAQACDPHGDAHECDPDEVCGTTYCWGPPDEHTGLLTCVGTCQ